MAFPPQPTYPKEIDSDYTLFHVYNTTETIITENNPAWSETISIKPHDPEIWASNGFATIEGELLYYDAVELDSDGFVVKLKKCARNLAGKKTQYNPAGTWIRSFVVAELHNQLVASILNTENFVGENFSEDEETLDWRIRHLQEEPSIFDDFACPDVEFLLNTLSSSIAQGTLIQYAVIISGNYGSIEISFGDGTTTTEPTGTHLYAPNANIDPVVTVTNGDCEIVQAPIQRDSIDSPEIPTPIPPFFVPVPIPPDFSNPRFPSCVFPNINVVTPPVIFPNINLDPIIAAIPSIISTIIPNIEVPSIISFTPINLPSVITFVNPPSVPLPSEITFLNVPTFSPIEFGPAPEIPTLINFAPAPSFDPINFSLNLNLSVGTVEFGPAPTFDPIEFGPAPTFGPIGFGPAPTFGPIGFGPAPTFGPIGFGPAPTFGPIEFGPAPTFGPIGFGPAPTFGPIGFGPAPTFGPIGFGPAPTFGPIGFGPAPTFGPIGFGPAPTIEFGPEPILGPIEFGPVDDFPSLIEFGPAPSFDPIQFEGCCDIPSIIYFDDCCDIPEVIYFGDPPSFANINFGPAPSFAPIQFDDLPVFEPINFGTPPLISVFWGTPPVVSCLVQVLCPSSGGGGVAPMRNFGMDKVVDPGFDQIELQYEMVGFPSEIKIVAPEIPPIKVEHDVPRIISLEPLEINVKVPEIPTEIRIVPPDLESMIHVISFEMPKTPLKIEVPEKFPLISFEKIVFPKIVIDASEIPESIRVVGIPDTIKVEGMPSFVDLRVPEGLKVPLVFEGESLKGELKVNWNIEELIKQTEESSMPCFAFVPCKKS